MIREKDCFGEQTVSGQEKAKSIIAVGVGRAVLNRVIRGREPVVK